MEANPPDGVDPNSQAFLDLRDDMQQDRFTVVIGGLVDTRWSDPAIRAGVLAPLPNVNEVKFERFGV